LQQIISGSGRNAMKGFGTPAAAALVVLAGLTSPGLASAAAIPAAAAPHSSSCAIHWGSKSKHAGNMARSAVLRVRAGQHACFDRLVIDIGKGARPGYRVEYVAQIIQDPSGKIIHVRGRAKLRIAVLAPAGKGFPANGRDLARVAGFRTFRQVVGAGSFEGVTSVGLGVRARLPFRVMNLSGPGDQSRLVIDVAHRW
jgi:hypothetical protein